MNNINLLKNLFRFNFSIIENKYNIKTLHFKVNSVIKYKFCKTYFILDLINSLMDIKQFLYILKQLFAIKKQIVLYSSSNYYLFYLFKKFESHYFFDIKKGFTNIIFKKTHFNYILKNNILNFLININSLKTKNELVRNYKNLMLKKSYLIYEINSFTKFSDLGVYKIYKDINLWQDFFFILLLLKVSFYNK